MGDKRHRNHSHLELMEQRAADDKRRAAGKEPAIIVPPPNAVHPLTLRVPGLYNPVTGLKLALPRRLRR